MSDYDEAQAIRRGITLIRRSDDGLNFSVLNFLVYCVLILLVIAAFASIF
jgi:hypothetical protein